MDKAQLLDRMDTAHRQLERYIFFFEKNEAGEMVAGRRPKFSLEEMEQSGVVDDWSLKDLLAHLIDWDELFIRWYRAGQRGG